MIPLFLQVHISLLHRLLMERNRLLLTGGVGWFNRSESDLLLCIVRVGCEEAVNFNKGRDNRCSVFRRVLVVCEVSVFVPALVGRGSTGEYFNGLGGY